MVSVPAKQQSEAAKYWQPAVHVAAKSSLPKTDRPVGAAPAEARSSENRSSASLDLTESHKAIEVIRKRPDFLAANRGKRFVAPGFVLLAHRRRGDHAISSDTVRYGITVTKKIGNAVARNRMKRRFRALLAELLPQFGLAGVDHIMIGRKEPKERDFVSMKADLEKGLKHLERKL